MKLTITLAFLLLSVFSFSQTEKPSYKAVAALFEKSYNAEDYGAIFSMFSAEMKNALPLEKTKQFLEGLQAQAGKVLSREFIRYENGTFASYKTQFERALFAVNISVDNEGKINGLFIKPYTDTSLPQMKRNLTLMQLPFKGEWTVFWGGDTREQNYHVDHEAQKHAFDLVVTDKNGRTYKTNGQTNEDYYAFGQELIAPCDGEVVLVVDGIKDNKPGEMNPIYIPGNTVVIKTKNNEYLLFAHFKQHSIKVKQGEQVTKGQLLGLCGNSGNSSEPHLHFHIQNTENMTVATGVKCYFEKLKVNGAEKKDYSPVRGEKISNWF